MNAAPPPSATTLDGCVRARAYLRRQKLIGRHHAVSDQHRDAASVDFSTTVGGHPPTVAERWLPPRVAKTRSHSASSSSNQKDEGGAIRGQRRGTLERCAG